jgi:hypothetical protein
MGETCSDQTTWGYSEEDLEEDLQEDLEEDLEEFFDRME